MMSDHTRPFDDATEPSRHIIVSWDNPEKTALIWYFEPGWTWRDLFLARDISQRFVWHVSHPVDIILDMTQGPELPGNALNNLSTVFAKWPANVRRIILIKPGPLIQNFIELVQGMMSAMADRVMVVNSVDDARAVTAEQTPSPYPGPSTARH